MAETGWGWGWGGGRAHLRQTLSLGTLECTGSWETVWYDGSAREGAL